jgi:hypothetical protein
MLPLHRTTVLALVAGTATMAVAAVAAPAQAAGTRTTLVVDTQFAPTDSAVVAASGPLAACTSVTDASNDPVGRTRNQPLFSGEKILHCGTATVTLGYQAFITAPDGNASGGAFTTHGSWWVIDSTLPGVSSGGGVLLGDGRLCVPSAESQGCILDTYKGSVS